jgi:hypothetical protein
VTSRFGEVDPAVVQGWGNHNRKYLTLLERNAATFDEVAAVTSVQGFPAAAGAEMRRLREEAAAPAEALRRIGVHYVYHFLAMNQRAVAAVRRRVREDLPLPDAHRELLVTIESQSDALASGFLTELSLLYAGPEPPRFLLCNVGAIWDHEDLDLWAIAAEPGDLPRVNALCGRLASESLRWAQRAQFYLSEHLPRNSFAGVPADYRGFLDRDLKNFVSVSQVLQATRLAGDPELERELDRELRDRYLASEPPTPLHEGFIRGALSEALSLLGVPDRLGLVDPKAEVYRLVRIVLACEAARLRLAGASPWAVLMSAAAAGPERAAEYECLGRAFDFAEVMRFLYSLFYAQEVPAHLENPRERAALAQVAEAMGYGPDPAEAVSALVRDYRAHRAAAREAAGVLAADLARYTKSLSVFYRILQRRSGRKPFDGLAGNLARILLRYVETHQRRVFWEDIVAICQEVPEVLTRWARDLASLRGRQLRWTVARYAKLMQEDPARFFEFVLLLAGGSLTQSAIADMLLDEAVALYGRDEEMLSRFVDLFHAFPSLVAGFVERVEPQVTTQLIGVVRRRWEVRRYRKAGVRLLSLLNLYHFSSNLSRRQSTRVLARFPEAVTFLDDFDELARMAQSAYAGAQEEVSAATRRQRLGDFYDLEFCRLSLLTLAGAPPRRVGREFRQSSERYIAALFASCVQEVAEAEEVGAPGGCRGVALFATGGNAREDPFDVDYDLFAVVDGGDPEAARFYNRALARLTRAVTERGIVPHNRFTDRFGRYLASVGALAEFFRSEKRDTFIEKTELLGCRRVAGDPDVEAALTRDVIDPFVFSDPSYPFELVAEIRSRREAGPTDEMEIKETAGGLRDGHLLISILKHRLHRREPDGAALFAHLRESLPDLALTLSEVEDTMAFLNRVRDVYRLTVVSEDRIDPQYFGVLALFMGYGDHPAGGARELLADYREALLRMQEALRACLAALDLPTAGL